MGSNVEDLAIGDARPQPSVWASEATMWWSFTSDEVPSDKPGFPFRS